MDRYQRVEKPREESQINENEIRITAQGRMRSYITYATTLLQYTDEVPNGGVFHPKVLCQVFDRVQHMPEKGSNEIVFKAMGRAINKTVMIVELIKRRIVGLHQITAVGSTDITDTWEPLEEGLLPLETTRHVSMIIITLSKVELDTNSVGYQPPLPKDQVKPLVEFDYDGEGSPNGRGRGHGGRNRGRARGNGNMVMDYGDVGYDNRGRGYGGRGGGWARGRGRSFRGHGRGGYVAWSDYPQENGGYHGGYDEFEAPSPGQGRGRGHGHGRGRGPSWGRGRGGYNRVNGGGNNGEA